MPVINILAKRALKRIEIYLNDENMGHLSNIKNREINLPAGQYKITVKYLWHKSKEFKFSLYNKENKSVVITINYVLLFMNALMHAIMLTFIQWLIYYLQLNHNFHKHHFDSNKHLILVFFIALILSMFLNRGKYVEIMERGR